MALVARLLLRPLLLMKARIVRLQQPLISLLCWWDKGDTYALLERSGYPVSYFDECIQMKLRSLYFQVLTLFQLIHCICYRMTLRKMYSSRTNDCPDQTTDLKLSTKSPVSTCTYPFENRRPRGRHSTRRATAMLSNPALLYFNLVFRPLIHHPLDWRRRRIRLRTCNRLRFQDIPAQAHKPRMNSCQVSLEKFAKLFGERP